MALINERVVPWVLAVGTIECNDISHTGHFSLQLIHFHYFSPKRTINLPRQKSVCSSHAQCICVVNPWMINTHNWNQAREKSARGRCFQCSRWKGLLAVHRTKLIHLFFSSFDPSRIHMRGAHFRIPSFTCDVWLGAKSKHNERVLELQK